jgi:hypothetical protein
MSAWLSTPALIATVVRDSTKPGAETVISKIPVEGFVNLKVPSSVTGILFVSPFAGFFKVTRALAMRAPLVLVILPERVCPATWAFSEVDT